MEIENAYSIIANKYDSNKDIIIQILDDYFNNINKNTSDNNKDNNEIKNIILPFCNKVYNECCKAIVFNHGLYTQCSNKTKSDVCKNCSKLKYGRIEQRLNVEPGKFVTSSGKKELCYKKFMKKMNYSYDDVRRELRNNNLEFNLGDEDTNLETRGRGRPKKAISEIESDVQIEVEKIERNGKSYLRTKEGIILDINTYEVLDE